MFYHVIIDTFALLVVRMFVTKLSAWQYQRAHGLAAARQIPQGENIFGIGQLRRMLKNTAASISLQSHFEATKDNGPTTSVVILGQKFVLTSDPENIKAVLATKFKDFDLGERNDAFGPFLGGGIFAADDAHWEKSRALIRPSFTKAQVAELPTVEEHFQNLVSTGLPTARSTGRIQYAVRRTKPPVTNSPVTNSPVANSIIASLILKRIANL
ncbi:hypothetical protein EJ02DRAFT_433585 [Clathrospora elynae]|uniref:Cytochrome P450 n=1 Tax=Clathrospora elynae TaxID=706981 RepID=A0A6A5S983_9PLEO|nr:hypothetical protein EJ02DRAFT_438067 [Clathrospora elynae]KAF1942904.1 hypothetical protein EJ02DRAFT_433585 [Clathrospora elynae]